jgi:hypothetical protein
MSKKPTMADACQAIAQSLREFGYSDATASMVWDCWQAMTDAKTEKEMPHGIIGRFAYAQLHEGNEWLSKLKQVKP